MWNWYNDMLKNSLCKLSKRHIHYRVNYNQNSKNSCQFAAFLNKHAFFFAKCIEQWITDMRQRKLWHSPINIHYLEKMCIKQTFWYDPFDCHEDLIQMVSNFLWIDLSYFIDTVLKILLHCKWTFSMFTLDILILDS